MKKVMILLLMSFSLSVFAEETVQINIVIKDGKFEPAELKAPANKKIELIVENKGPGAEEFESIELKREKIIPQGRTVKINLGVLKKGVYPFFGEFHIETAQGKLIVD
jgi:Cupredoxin-like domain